MIQFYTPDDIRDINETKAFEVFKDIVKPFQDTLDDYYNGLYQSSDLGKVIRSPITDLWADAMDVYPQWHELYKDLQTTDDLIAFIDALYGSATVEITNPAPLVLNWGVLVETVKGALWNRDSCYNLSQGDIKDFPDDKEPQIFLQDNDDAVIVFDIKTVDISNDALDTILNDVVYPGLYYTVDVNK